MRLDESVNPSPSAASTSAVSPSSSAFIDALFEEVRQDLRQTPRQTPLGTYRMQLHKDFGFEAARKTVPYLARLGITDFYSSPILKATPGSQHGYDVVDHRHLNPECGTDAELTALTKALQQHGLGYLLDVVPNHMGIERDNPLWRDVLENGPASLAAETFDIDWNPVKEELENKVLLPILGGGYGEVLERGELELVRTESGGFDLKYFDHRFPIAPRAYATILGHELGRLVDRVGTEDDELLELRSILTALRHLAPHHRTLTREARVERNREKKSIQRRISALLGQSEAIRTYVDENLRILNGMPGRTRSFDGLHEILESCAYRLASWRVAGEEINYRRFFDINTLAAVRTEDPDVFRESHALLFQWLESGKVTGFRIDHPDGLFDPTEYFIQLQAERFVQLARAKAAKKGEEAVALLAQHEAALRQRFHAEVTQHPDSELGRALYVVVEKIQGGRERIPENWAVDGTVGYRFANSVTGLFVDGEAEKTFTDTYESFIGNKVDFDELVYQKKRLILSTSMASEMNVLAQQLNRISEMNRRTRDFTLNSLRLALIEFVALFPVYRTYVDDSRPEPDSRDSHYIQLTIAKAKRKAPTINAAIFEFLRDIALRRYPEHLDEGERAVWLRFAMKLQQLTGPVMAKGLEDTVFYLYNRFIALNEVGGEPEHFGADVPTFHERNQERVVRFPAAMLCSSTHDTKRSEDVRYRLAALSEFPNEWSAAVERLRAATAGGKTELEDGGPAPYANDEYLFFQTVLGAWPMGTASLEGEALNEFRGRIEAYMLKALKEGKAHTSWTNPDERYEEAMRQYIGHALSSDTPNTAFLAELKKLLALVETPGMVNSLSAGLLKLGSSGAADFYQGCELWDLSLVDPDNRRPVDYAHRESLLTGLERALETKKTADAETRTSLCRELWKTRTDGRIKLYTLMEGLKLRQRQQAVFRRGAYTPLELVGPQAGNAVAFLRHLDGQYAVVVAPRLCARFVEPDGSGSASLAGTRVVLPESLAGLTLRDVYSGRTLTPTRGGGQAMLELQDIWQVLPLAFLEGSRST